MTTPNDINPDGYAVVFYGWDGNLNDTPKICKVLEGYGVRIDGCDYAIYDDPDEAAEEFKRWPSLSQGQNYGILPVRMLIEEAPPTPRYRLKASAR